MQSKQRRFLQVSVIGATLLMTAVSGGIVLARFDRGASHEAVPALLVRTVLPEPQASFDLDRVFSGRVQARRDSLLGFEQRGALAVVYVDEGALVERGELLAELDTRRLSAQRAELQAVLAEAEANLALAEATLRRMEGVLQAGGVSHQGLDEARQGRRAARAAVQLAHRRIASVGVEFDKARLTAPFGGTVVARLADEGRVLEAGEAVLRLQATATPEIRIGVAGEAVDSLRIGQEYTLQWRKHSLRARLRAVLPLRAAAARTVDGLLDPLDPPAGLRPGDLVVARLATPVAEPGIWLPLSALAEGERGLWSVYVTEDGPDAAPPAGLMASHRIVPRTVEVIHQEADRVYVRGTLGPQDRVVAAGLHRIVPGQWVRSAPHSTAKGRRSDD